MKSVVLTSTLLMCAIAIQVYPREPANVQTIIVAQSRDQFTLTPAEIETSSGRTIRWSSGKSGIRFRIEFVGRNPCDPDSSSLDKNPARCVISGTAPAEYAYEVSGTPGRKSDHIITCDHCDTSRSPTLKRPAKGTVKVIELRVPREERESPMRR